MMKTLTGTIAASMTALSVLGVTQAEAACSPVFGANTPPPGTTVTCLGSNAATYGDVTQSGLTINVQSGASVTSATAEAFDLDSDNAINNSGTIQSTFGIAIYTKGTVDVTNSGSISGVSSNGTIVTLAAGLLNIVNTTTGTITTGAGGLAINGYTDVIVVNAGTISSGTGGFAVLAGRNLNLTNTGTISSTGPISSASTVSAQGNAVINNGSGGSITSIGGFAAIDIFGGSVINAGTISGTVLGIYFGSGSSSLTNSGTIIGGVDFFGGGNNTLTLLPGSNITGNVLGFGNDTFQLGGTGTATFDTSTLGGTSQYQGFSTYNKIGASSWELTGNGGTGVSWNVNGGTLLANGSILSPFTVNSGGTLGGSGSVGNTTINGGTLSPGNSIGTLTVGGSLVFTAAATYLVQVSPTASDRTNVTGTATLGGATVNASFAAGSYVARQYTILNATGGVNGRFGSVVNTNLPPGFASSLSYDANDVYLNLNLGFTQYGGLNTNQRNVANALTNFFNASGGIPAAFGTLTPAGLTQVSGELATGAQQTTFDAMNLFLGVLTDPFVAGRGDAATPVSTGASSFADRGVTANAYAAIARKALVPADTFASRWSVWAAGFGGSQTTDGNATLGSNTATSRVGGVTVGADYWLTPQTIVGFALAGGGTNFSVNGLGGGRSDLFQAGAFVRHTVGSAYITAAAAYGWQDITTDRTVTIAGIDQLHAHFNANAYSGRIEGGNRYVMPWLGIGITPYAAVQVTAFALPSYAETVASGTNTFALSYGGKTVTATRSELGLRSDKSYVVGDSLLTLRGRAAWAHDYNTDRNVAATFQTLPGASFVVNGASPAHDAALTTASAEMKWINGWSAAATFEGEFSQVTRSYAGKGIIRYDW